MKRKIIIILIVIFVVFIITGFFTGLSSGYIRIPNKARLNGCTSNLKAIATALETYSEKYNNQYPNSLNDLAPVYIDKIPECNGQCKYLTWYGNMVILSETSPIDSYSAGYKQGNNRDTFILFCDGNRHSYAGIPQNYPRYDSIKGIILTPE